MQSEYQIKPKSTLFPFKSKYLKVNGANIHYVDEGQGDPILFLHGIPASNYAWRNIIPALTPQARCIAPDLIGMGKSDKPDIAYRIFDHIDYITRFIEALDLHNVTLVLHGWGSVIGFHYAMQHEANIKGLAFYEAFIRPLNDWDMLSLPIQQLLAMLTNRKASYHAVIEDNYLINKLLPRSTLRKLTTEEMDYYRAPFREPKDRRVLWQYIVDLPINAGANDVIKLIDDYAAKLQKSPVPKLMLYAVPGFITTISTIEWCKKHLPNLMLADLGEALHFAQESEPERFADALSQWYQKVVSSYSR